jgi:hypothetical protein
LLLGDIRCVKRDERFDSVGIDIDFLSVQFILMLPLSLTLVMRYGPDQFGANFLFLERKLCSSNQIWCPNWYWCSFALRL